MSNPDSPQQHYSTVEFVLEAIADWVNWHRNRSGHSDELQSVAPDEVMQIARDMGVSPGELRELSRSGSEAAVLLQKMLVALKVEPEALRRSEPGVMHDLQRLCTLCAEKKRCMHELADGTEAEHFHEFCPNAHTFDALIAQMGRPH